jgi:hypothetical protein
LTEKKLKAWVHDTTQYRHHPRTSTAGPQPAPAPGNDSDDEEEDKGGEVDLELDATRQTLGLIEVVDGNLVIETRDMNDIMEDMFEGLEPEDSDEELEV